MYSNTPFALFIILPIFLMVDIALFLDIENVAATSLGNFPADCIYFEDCPSAMQLISTNRHNLKTIELLRSAHCGTIGKRAIIRCNAIPVNKTSPSGSLRRSKGSKVNVPKHNCIDIYQCPKALELILTEMNDAKTAELLRSAYCEKRGERVFIKCNAIWTDMNYTNAKKLLPNPGDCGMTDMRQAFYEQWLLAQQGINIQHTFRAVPAGWYDFPWLALLLFKNARNSTKYMCHASLINPKYVISAAHCIKNNHWGTLYKVVLGRQNIDDDWKKMFQGREFINRAKEYSVEKIHVHPGYKYNFSFVQNDIALIRVVENIKYTDYIKPICLPLTPLHLNNRQLLKLTGFGATETKKMSDVKLTTNVTFVEVDECFDFMNIRTTQNDFICARSSDGADSCKGDSGGPLIVEQNITGGWSCDYLFGIVSFGGRRCGLGGMYSNTSHYMNWILYNLKP